MGEDAGSGAQRVTLEMVTDALKLAGIELKPSGRRWSTAPTRASRGARPSVGWRFPTTSRPFHFSAIVPGIDVDKTKKAFRLSAAPTVRRPANLEEVAFWPVRHLAELIKAKRSRPAS